MIVRVVVRRNDYAEDDDVDDDDFVFFCVRRFELDTWVQINVFPFRSFTEELALSDRLKTVTTGRLRSGPERGRQLHLVHSGRLKSTATSSQSVLGCTTPAINQPAERNGSLHPRGPRGEPWRSLSFLITVVRKVQPSRLKSTAGTSPQPRACIPAMQHLRFTLQGNSPFLCQE